MIIKGTTVFERNWTALNSNIRYIKNEGGSRSSKTYSLCQALILYCLENPGTSVSIIRKTFPALRASVMRDFFEVLKNLNIYKKSNHSKSDNIYYFDNESFVEFFSADDEQKIRGRKRDIAWVNEANELWYEDFKQIAMRTTNKIIVDYNPSESSSWLYQIPENKTISIHSTYKDNPFISREIIEEIESYKETDEDYYTIFALGLRAFSKQNVYSKWNTSNVRPDYFEEFIYGCDFGYVHPTALIKIWFNIDRNELYLEEEIYESYLTANDIIDRMDRQNVSKNIVIPSDYARPEIIKDMTLAGYQAINAIKDVKDGIMNVKSFKITVDSSAINILKENENYKYKKFNGEITEEVLKLYDDAMDAIRYGVFYIKKYHSKSGDPDLEVYNFNF